MLVASTQSGTTMRESSANARCLSSSDSGAGLDHELRLCEAGGRCGGLEAPSRSLGVVAAHAAALGATREPGADLLYTPRDCFGRRVVEQRARAGEACEFGDAGAHRAGAEDADRPRWGRWRGRGYHARRP